MTFGHLLVLVLILDGFGIWYLLNRREKNRVAKGLPRHSAERLITATFAILTVLFSGGCGGMLLFGWITDGMQSKYIGWKTITVYSLPPLLIGLLVWWLAMRRKVENDKA